MDHSTAEAQLEDWVAGRLPPDRAEEVAAHARACAECAAQADLLRRLGREVASHGEGLFTPHPTGDELARLVLDPDGLALEQLRRLGAHVHACPACEAERRLIRAAARPAPLRALAAWLAGSPPAGAWLRPALAAMVLLLAWPAWLGIVEYPRARQAAERARAEAGRARPEAPGVAVTPGSPGGAAPGWSGGGAGILLLSGATRGAGEEMPTASLRPGQPALTVVVDQRLTAPGPLVASLADAAGRSVWQAVTTADELWDPHARVTSLMLPAAAIAPGDYTLTLRSRAGPPAFEARFRIVP